MKRRKSINANVAKPIGLDLGTLHTDFIASRRALKASSSRLASAQDAHDMARTAHTVAADKLKAASRAVLAEA